MSKIDDVSRQVMEKSEWVAIATAGPDGPHLAATWGNYIQNLGIQDDVILIPAGHLNKTEANLRTDRRIELLFASRAVQGSYGPGRGCRIVGTGQLLTTGPIFDGVKAKYSWARGALAVKVQSVSLQL